MTAAYGFNYRASQLLEASSEVVVAALATKYTVALIILEFVSDYAPEICHVLLETSTM